MDNLVPGFKINYAQESSYGVIPPQLQESAALVFPRGSQPMGQLLEYLPEDVL